MTMGWIGLGTAAISAAGSAYSANQNKKAAAEANSGELPDWLKPYMLGTGVPNYVNQDPMVNTNWLDRIDSLGQGNWNSPWQPMTADNLRFNPEGQFTPGPADAQNPYGVLPDGMNQPPPMQQMPQPQQMMPPQPAPYDIGGVGCDGMGCVGDDIRFNYRNQGR